MESPSLLLLYQRRLFVEGVSLYDWAQAQCPTSRQVLRVLASLARALEATHAAGGVHRDVKGDNVLVRAADGQVFLTDFGSGSYVGAALLTSSPLPPGTPPYRSPEAWRSVRLPYLPSDTPYAPGPADDVFALGMTAYRLVTDDYPPTPALLNEVAHLWGPEGRGPVPPLGVNARCCAELSRLVSRMLSVRPEARGGAGELAEALEQAARRAGREADVPLFTRKETPCRGGREGPSPGQGACPVVPAHGSRQPGSRRGAGSRMDAERAASREDRTGSRIRHRRVEGWRHHRRRRHRTDCPGVSHPGTVCLVCHCRGSTAQTAPRAAPARCVWAVCSPGACCHEWWVLDEVGHEPEGL